MVFPCSLSDSKPPQVSGTLLSILTDLNNAVVWMVLIWDSNLQFFQFSFLVFGDRSKYVVTVPSAPITICIIVTFMFYSFLCSQARSKYLSLCYHSVVRWFSKVPLYDKFFFLLAITKSYLLAGIWWSGRILKSQRILCVSFFRSDSVPFL